LVSFESGGQSGAPGDFGRVDVEGLHNVIESHPPLDVFRGDLSGGQLPGDFFAA
jgi:hypothetical protein